MKKYKEFWKYIKNGKISYKFQWYWNRKWKKKKIYQHKIPISIKNIDINKTVVSNKASFGKTVLKISSTIKIRLL